MSDAEPLSYLGRLHSLVLAAPLGLVLMVALAELVGWRRLAGDGRRLRAWVLALTALSATLAFATGWLLAADGEYRGSTATAHRGLGAALTAALILVWLVDRLVRPGRTWRALRRLAVAAVVVAAAMAWISGAGVTHGRSWLLRGAPPWAGAAVEGLDGAARGVGEPLGAWLESLLPEQPLGPHDLLVVPPRDAAPPTETDAAFGLDEATLGEVHLALDGLPGASPDEAAALAVLEAHCWRCHGPDKQKANLRLDTPDGLAGVITPGQAEASLLYERITLPPDDFDVMPPDATLAPTDIAVLRDWLDAGAPLTTVASRAEQEAQRRAQTGRALAALARSTGAVVLPLGGAEALGVDYSLADELPDASVFAPLQAVADRLVELSLAGRSLPPDGAAAVPLLPALERLHLERTGADDATVLAWLRRAPSLRYLNLHGTAVTGAVLDAAADLPALRRLVLAGTAIDPERLEAFADRRPDVLVTGDLALPDDPFAGGGPRRLLVAGEGPGRVVLLRELTIGQHDLLWEHPVERVSDLQWTPDRTVLFQTDVLDLLEVEPFSGEERWRYDGRVQNRLPEHGSVQIHGFERLADGGTLIGESGATRLVEVDVDGLQRVDVPLRVDKPDREHDTRNVRKTPAGTYLVAHELDGVVREYTDTGVLVWEYRAPLFGRAPVEGTGPEGWGNRIHAVQRLADGNTLISTGNGKSILEVARDKTIVWQLTDEDLPDIQLSWISSVQVLPDGHLLFVNRHAAPGQPQIVEVDRDKRVVWTFRDDELFPDGVVAALVVGGEE